jgi:hypothetical protein
MTRFCWPVSFGVLLVFLTACFDSPSPCVGEDCPPPPCQTVATARVFSVENRFTSQTTLEDCYTPGTSATVLVAIQPATADLSAEQTVIVFDIVNRDQGTTFPSYAKQLLESVRTEPDIFKEPLASETVKAGLQADLSFRLKRSAPSGNYSLVISFFRLSSGQKPSEVTSNPAALAGRVFYYFKLER